MLIACCLPQHRSSALGQNFDEVVSQVVTRLEPTGQVAEVVCRDTPAFRSIHGTTRIYNRGLRGLQAVFESGGLYPSIRGTCHHQAQLDPSVPLGDDLQDLDCTDPIPGKPVVDHADYTAPRGNMSQIIQTRNTSALTVNGRF